MDIEVVLEQRALTQRAKLHTLINGPRTEHVAGLGVIRAGSGEKGEGGGGEEGWEEEEGIIE